MDVLTRKFLTINGILYKKGVVMTDVYFKNVTGVGDLYLDNVFIKLEDENILFLCEDNKGSKYLCLCYEFRWALKWVLCEITAKTVSELISRKTDLKTAFEQGKDNIINIIYKDNQETFKRVSFNEIESLINPYLIRINNPEIKNLVITLSNTDNDKKFVMNNNDYDLDEVLEFCSKNNIIKNKVQYSDGVEREILFD